MDFGLCLPNFRDGASREGLEAGAETAERLGWSVVWTTDHVLVPISSAEDYGTIYDAIEVLAWIGARFSTVRLATSVIVVPQRNAVILAKELATIDALSGGRLIAGVGAGWNEEEFRNLGAAERFHVRGAYLDETIDLWRHLWSGSTEPFHGRFHDFEDFVFSPLPAQGGSVPIVVGGRAERALRRAATKGDWYHSSSTNPSSYGRRVPTIRAAAEEAGRPMPRLTTRAWVEFGDVPDDHWSIRGTPEEMAAEVRAFADLGVDHIGLWFMRTDPDELVRSMERFDREVVPLVQGAADTHR
jgi:probable F420-dependent oxidoreductase